MAERLPLAEVLRAVLAEDRTLLARREDLLAAMEQRVTPGLMRDYRSFQKAVQSSTVGELFLTADGASIEAQGNIRIQVMKILRNLGMQTRAAYRVEETFAQALGWPSVSTQVYQAMMRNDDSARHSSQESWQMEELLQRVAALEEENHALREMQTRLQQKVETLERKCDERNQQVKNLERRLERLERAYKTQQEHLIKQELSQAKSRIAQQGRQVEATRPAVQTVPMPRPRTAPAAPAVPSWETRARKFAAAYNQFLQTKVSGTGARNLKERFLQKHQIVGFSCVNYADRMSNPNIQPLFQINENQKEAHYWACPLGGNLYAVVPNSREYEMRKHTTVGYGKVFRSNYAGGVYHSITVIQPAIFRELVLQRPGRLLLSE